MNTTRQSSLVEASFVPQLVAAIDRHEEAQNWGSWLSVMVARQAVGGDEYAQTILANEAGWQLTPEGLLP